jgi:hypothetical protein
VQLTTRQSARKLYVNRWSYSCLVANTKPIGNAAIATGGMQMACHAQDLIQMPLRKAGVSDHAFF